MPDQSFININIATKAKGLQKIIKSKNIYSIQVKPPASGNL